MLLLREGRFVLILRAEGKGIKYIDTGKISGGEEEKRERNMD